MQATSGATVAAAAGGLLRFLQDGRGRGSIWMIFEGLVFEASWFLLLAIKATGTKGFHISVGVAAGGVSAKGEKGSHWSREENKVLH